MNATVVAAVERYFRLYARHLSSPDLDSLLAMLESLHGLNDKLRSKVEIDLFGSDAFTALKALRNFFHHEEELFHRVRILPFARMRGAQSDLLFACLVERELVDRALSKVQSTKSANAVGTMNWYGPIVDIQPCLYNAAVDVYEAIAPLDLGSLEPHLQMFRDSYERETGLGLPHKVSGRIITRAGDATAVLMEAFLSAPSPPASSAGRSDP